MRAARGTWVAIATVIASVTVLGSARADDAPPTDDTSTLFATGVRALQEERPGDAIANFEALADRGVVDPRASFDRGLAYAERWRAGKGAPGDLGRAAQGFEEARSLAAGDASLAQDATHALSLVRSEIARRRALAGDPIDVDPGVPLGRAIVELASEETWAALALFAAIVLTGALITRRLSGAHRARIGAAIAIGVASPLLAVSALLALAARDGRLHRTEAILVAESARLADDRHIVVAGAPPLPEAARVAVDESNGGWSRVRFGALQGWVPTSSVRAILRPK